MTPRLLPLPATLLFLFAPLSQADVLELKGGKVLNGTYAGGTAGTKVYGRVQSVQQARRYTGQSKLDLPMNRPFVVRALARPRPHHRLKPGLRTTGS